MTSVPTCAPTAPIVFLDFDDVIAINKVYGAYDVVRPSPKPPDLFERLFHAPAVGILLRVVDVHKPQVVITTNWLRFFDRETMVELLNRTGLAPVAEALHVQWQAPVEQHMSRLRQIEKWLATYHEGQSYVVLDDVLSGTELAGSVHDAVGRVVLCDEGVGLHNGHWPQISKALTTPWTRVDF
jgi:hypothetical protein